MDPEKIRKALIAFYKGLSPKTRKVLVRVFASVLAVTVAFALCVVYSSLFGSGALTPNKILHAIGVREYRCDGANGCLAFYGVGQGDCSVVYDDHTVGLIDVGPYEYAHTIVNKLDVLRVEKIDFVVISHPHDDHAGGYQFLLEQYPVKTLYIGQYNEWEFEDYDYYRQLLEVSRKYGVEIVFPTDGMQIRYEQFSLTFYAPGFYTQEENEKCLLVMAQMNDVRCLYMGDAGRLTESFLLERGYDLKADILKVGHHGSKTATTEAFLQQVQPKYAVISVGYNFYGHPADLVVDRLYERAVAIYRTDSWELTRFMIAGSDVNVLLE